MTLKERLLKHVMKTEYCWEWTGYLNENGYGRITVAGKVKFAHRISWTLFRGQIPDGLVVDHVCRNRKCVNPEHLRVVTFYQNIMENSLSPSAIRKKLTACKRGHPFNQKNTRFKTVNGHTHRECRPCVCIVRKQRKQKLAPVTQ